MQRTTNVDGQAEHGILWLAMKANAAFAMSTGQHPADRRRRQCAATVILFGLSAVAGCASGSLNAQWSDPQFAGRSLRGERVLMACQASDMTLRRICADRGADKLSTLGALPVPAADSDVAAGDPSLERQTLLQAARVAGVAAVLQFTLTPAATSVTPGPSISFGIGGFGGGYSSGGGIGIGMSAPLGGTSAETGYSASASLTDVASGRLMWSANASAPPSSNLNEQLGTLTTLLLDSARSAGLFAQR